MLKLAANRIRRITEETLNTLPSPVIRALVQHGPRARTLRYYLRENKQIVYRTPEPLLGCARFHVDKFFVVERSILTTGSYDRESLKLLNRLVPSEAVCVDAGANIGAIAFGLATAAKRGKVFAFEPGSQLYARLMANISLNPEMAARVIPINLGLSDEPETLFWQADPLTPGNAFLSDKEGERIETTTLDHHFEKQNLKRLDMIKIDVEGMECKVLEGGRRLIEEYKPMIYYESHVGLDAMNDARLQRIEDFLRGFGYHFYHSAPGGIKETSFPHLSQNTLAIAGAVRV